ncbi:MAG: multidrug efflux RND transporter permease subunit [Armatimonadetes bacterium]|nr:multidrug efflux RND transporter permease subunit [Armatimonadota bacterium]
MAKFFLHRPVFAIVVSLVILLAGGLAIPSLPIAQYPPITPPTIVVSANYTGADARTVAETVAEPIEEQVNGSEHMLYMQSKSTNDGRMQLIVTYEVGTDQDLALVDVQNRVNQATSSLPPEVVQSGITVKKQSTTVLMYLTLYSPDNSRDTLFLSNYATLNLTDQLGRINGVGQASIVVGEQDYSMRLWIDPDKLAHLGVTATDISAAVQSQNVQAAAGTIGAPPVPPGQQLQYPVTTRGRLETPREFGNIIVRTQSDGSILRVRDVARVELGAASYSSFGRYNGKPCVPIGIYQITGANALKLSEQVRSTMEEMARSFPPGLAYEVTYDSTDFIEASIEEVIETLFEAIGLVLIVVFVFLGSFRSSLIPMLAVPVSLVGTFAGFSALGFSINLLTLFGLVLAVGLVVDDAIVVVEAVEHHIEQGLSPIQATEKAMEEVQGPVIAIALVICSVFVPVAFLGGITGEMYRQFALTLAVSVVLSALVALTLTPALCTLILRPRGRMRGPLGWFVNGFNRVFGGVTDIYTAGVRRLLRLWPLALIALGLVYAGAWYFQTRLPTGFIPPEDNGWFVASITLPDGSSLERTNAVIKKVEKVLGERPGVQSVLALGGFGMIAGAYGSNYGTVIVVLKPWDERKSKEEQAFSMLRALYAEFRQWPEAAIIVFNPPPIPGLGTSGGVTLEIENRAGRPLEELAQANAQFLEACGRRSELSGTLGTLHASIPVLDVEVDRDKVLRLGINLNDVFKALQVNLGGLYVNQFNLYGKTWRVFVQAEPRFRVRPSDIGALYVRTAGGNMVPLSNLVRVLRKTGPDLEMRYNLFEGAEVSSNPAAGYSSGQAIEVLEQVAGDVLPSGFGYEWTGTAYQELLSGESQALTLVLGLVFVFLFLAAQYESWGIPFSVLLGLPVAVLGAYAATSLTYPNNNIYTQIGLVMLIGLAAKNAILIVEFAKMKHDHEGLSAGEAAIEGARLRFRPILMTSFALILGVLPLVTASGASAVSRISLGSAVFGGMIAATALGVFFIPVLYALIQGLVDWLGPRREGLNRQPPADESHPLP